MRTGRASAVSAHLSALLRHIRDIAALAGAAHPDALRQLLECAGPQIENGSGIRCHRIESVFLPEAGRKGIRHRVLSVHDEDPRWLLHGEAIDPLDQSRLVCVTGQAVQLTDLRPDRDRLSEDVHLLRTVRDAPPRRADGLISHEQNRAFRPPQIVFEVVLDASSIAHAGRRDDHLGLVVAVDTL